MPGIVEQKIEETKEISEEKQEDEFIPQTPIPSPPRNSFQELEESQNNDDISDYEKIRLKNIAEQKAMFLNSLKKTALDLSASMTPKPAPKPITPRRLSLKDNQMLVGNSIIERKNYTLRDRRSLADSKEKAEPIVHQGKYSFENSKLL